MANRLANSTSPYLLQHADNPVDWWPWGPEALAEAAERNVPILLSVGYAACHWCHVMAHESFEDDEIAAVMNEHFVNVKVDREERPDIDAVYMSATQAMTGQGGWPMTCFLTPDGKPFHCGTYYPPAPVHGMPAFRQVLDAVARAWDERPEELTEGAGKIVEHLEKQSGPLREQQVDDELLTAAVTKLREETDPGYGGFGGAPKFPPSMVLEFLVRHYERTANPAALSIVELTAEGMARGGIYDQLAGGFARYSVDGRWVVPHFEKMLYDNALLLRVYTHLARRTGHAGAQRVAADTAEFLMRDLRTPQGGFAASLDADTDGVEGLTYVWTPKQLVEVLGEDDGAWAAETFAVTDEGTFEEGASTLQLPADPDDTERWQRVRTELLTARNRRPQPDRDDKVVAAWNGLAVAALAEAGTALGEPEWVDAAGDAARLLLDVHAVDGKLRRTSRDGVVGEADGVLEDYACTAEGLLALHQATGDPEWLGEATRLLDVAVDRFAAEAPGAFHDTADDAEQLINRPADPTDNATPSGASALASALLTASALAGPDRATRYRSLCEKAVARAGALVTQVPRFAGNWAAVAEAMQTGPLQVAVVGEDAAARQELVATAARRVPGGSVVLAGTPESADVPLLADRPLVDGEPAAYVCRGYVCERPVTTSEDLVRQLTL
ncbi:N-acylglucosamine 2-epimerase [Saccharomonospora sp. CUA-673]|uniref:thioredoxin domain-containing protein n=1 Tax=Saccharomonospora sp. CUA-673 TaxID=1904969 RepID=UPI0009660630|nr:thioredoxin domain-containing protein [Saccharomonospora sp. CUA-673]OLT49209.1 N-acylglucosamine 2-epimerase [Saccharomonospora sp. CUA-673]